MSTTALNLSLSTVASEVEVGKRNFIKALAEQTIDFDSIVPSNRVLVELDESFESTDVPLKVSLFIHQRTAIAAMVSLERNPHIQFNNASARICAAVLSEPVGSGKTLELIGMIAENAHLDAIDNFIPPYTTYHTLPTHGGNSIGWLSKKYNKQINSTIIVVGKAVYEQWAASIENNTDIPYQRIGNKAEIEYVLRMATKKNPKFPPILLVKHDVTSASIDFPDCITLDKRTEGTSKYYVNILALLTNICWRRLVIDDFDSIKIPANCGTINASFTWFVSSTRRALLAKKSQINNGDVESIIRTITNNGYGNVMQNTVLFNAINVRNNFEYIKSSYTVPRLNVNIVNIKIASDTLIALISDLTGNSSLIELLNSSAHERAAEITHADSSNIVDIYQKLLGNNYAEYKNAKDNLDFANNILANQAKLKAPGPGMKYTYTKKLFTDGIKPVHSHRSVITVLNEVMPGFQEKKDRTGAAIRRVKDRLKDNQCISCWNEFTDTSMDISSLFITRCCNIIYCVNCALAQRASYDDGTMVCPACRGAINNNTVVVVDASKSSLKNIIEENLSTPDDQLKIDEPPESSETPESSEPPVTDEYTKFSAAVDIILGNTPPNTIRIKRNFNNVLLGTSRLPDAPYRKVLIFTTHEETIQQYQKILTEKKIHFFQLCGSIRDITATLQKFRNLKHIAVLLVQSTKYCAGMNIQFATDLIFMHRIDNEAEESQVVGRIQRIGRTTQPNVWYLLHDNENEALRTSTNYTIDDEEDITEAIDVTQIKDNQYECDMIDVQRYEYVPEDA